MKDYKRLTNNNKDEYDCEIDFCSGCQYHGEPNGCNRPNGECDNYDRFCEIYNRLAELEDKIENGTLIELPCKVGDIVYYIWEYDNRIDMGYCKVSLIELHYVGNYQAGFVFINPESDINEFNEMYCKLRFDKFGESWFIDKEQAEQKLKELKGE